MVFLKNIIYNKISHTYFLGVGFLVLLSCTPEVATTEALAPFELEIPSHFPEPNYGVGQKRLIEKRVELGRKLFYDPILSVDGTVSCGSCHHQTSGFSDEGKPFSAGVKGRVGLRNSPALSNLAWFPAFLADGGVNHIEVMPLAPLTDSLEMADDLNNILLKLKNNQAYKAQFNAAFSDSNLTSKQLLIALAQFMSSMVSSASKYDAMIKGEAAFTVDEKAGLKLFELNCATCHKPPLFTDFSYRNNGLVEHYEDNGRARITGKQQDEATFKVPSLRNINVSKPYMHNGSIATLKEVVEHYNSGIIQHQNLDPSLQNGISLSTIEKQQLLSFLETLTDYKFLSNPNFSNPKEK